MSSMGVSNNRRLDCLFKPFVQAQIKENIKAPCHRQIFVMEIHWWPVDSPHEGAITRKMFPFDGVIMI